MTEKHVVADGDVPDNSRSVLAWWSEESGNEWNSKWSQYEIAHLYNELWYIITDNGWMRCFPPDFWWELPEVDA